MGSCPAQTCCTRLRPSWDRSIRFVLRSIAQNLLHSNSRQIIADTKAAVNDAHRTLTDDREGFATAVPHISAADGPERAAHALETLDATINTMADFGGALVFLEKRTEEVFQDASSMSGSTGI